MIQAQALSLPEEESSHSGSVELQGLRVTDQHLDVPLRQALTSLLKQVEICQRNVCSFGVFPAPM